MKRISKSRMAHSYEIIGSTPMSAISEFCCSQNKNFCCYVALLQPFVLKTAPCYHSSIGRAVTDIEVVKRCNHSPVWLKEIWEMRHPAISCNRFPVRFRAVAFKNMINSVQMDFSVLLRCNGNEIGLARDTGSADSFWWK